MTDRPQPKKPDAEELAAADVQLRAFLARIKAVPEADRTPNTSEKFSGPIAQEVVELDSPDPDGER